MEIDFVPYAPSPPGNLEDASLGTDVPLRIGDNCDAAF
jgi:hypothetical protein